MRKFLIPVIIFIATFWIYLGTATQFTFHPKWVIDYFNPLTQSILHGRLDLVNPPETYDLAFFRGSWYAPWGILPVVALLPVQLFMGRFVPTIYFTVFFASLDVVLMYLLLLRVKKQFYPDFSHVEIILVLILFAFGTTHFYVGTLGSVWHVDQMITNFFGMLGLYIIFKKRRDARDYIASAWILGLALLGRATIVLIAVVPFFLYVWERKKDMLLKGIFIFGVPMVVFGTLFFLYNFIRFQNPFDYGYSFIKESPYLMYLRQTYGAMSLTNILRNAWYMLFEIPFLTYETKLKLGFNLNGNSIFFLTPPFLSVFLTKPLLIKGKKFVIDPFIAALGIAAVITILPSLLIYSSGWMQFGYRYSLDITAILVLLSVFGMKGKLNVLYFFGVIFSIVMYSLGIQALM